MTVARIFTHPSVYVDGPGMHARHAPDASEAEVGADGLFSIEAPPFEETTICIASDGYTTVFLPLTIGHDTPETAREIELVASADLQVHVLDGRGGRIANVKVTLRTHAYNLLLREGQAFTTFSEVLSWTGTTNAGGICLLEGLPAGVPLYARLEGDVTRSFERGIELEPAELGRVDLTLGHGATLLGKMLDQYGEPVEGQLVWRSEARDLLQYFVSFRRPVQTTTTDQQGDFTLENVPAGTWWIGPAHETRGAESDVAAVPVVVEVTEASGEQHVDIPVHRGLYVRGVVVDEQGDPAPEAPVAVASRETIWGHFNDTAGEDGTFSIGPLAPGPVLLEAGGYGRGDYAATEPIEVEVPSEGHVLRVLPGARIAGRVVGLDGTPTPAAVSLLETSRPHRTTWRQPSKEGAFRFTALKPGGYALTAQTTDGRFALLTDLVAQNGSELDLNLVLEPCGTVRVHYEGEQETQMYALVVGELQLLWDRLAPGESKDHQVPAGTVIVHPTTARGPTPGAEIPAEIPAGAVVDVRLR